MDNRTVGIFHSCFLLSWVPDSQYSQRLWSNKSCDTTDLEVTRKHQQLQLKQPYEKATRA